jgi:hypothetical protein
MRKIEEMGDKFGISIGKGEKRAINLGKGA